MTKTIPSMTVAAAQSLPQVRVPLLALYGARDALVNTDPSLARLRALNPRMQAKVYANSGHAPFLEEAQRFNHDLAAFVEAARK